MIYNYTYEFLLYPISEEILGNSLEFFEELQLSLEQGLKFKGFEVLIVLFL